MTEELKGKLNDSQVRVLLANAVHHFDRITRADVERLCETALAVESECALRVAATEEALCDQVIERLKAIGIFDFGPILAEKGALERYVNLRVGMSLEQIARIRAEAYNAGFHDARDTRVEPLEAVGMALRAAADVCHDEQIEAYDAKAKSLGMTTEQLRKWNDWVCSVAERLLVLDPASVVALDAHDSNVRYEHDLETMKMLSGIGVICVRSHEDTEPFAEALRKALDAHDKEIARVNFGNGLTTAICVLLKSRPENLGDEPQIKDFADRLAAHDAEIRKESKWKCQADAFADPPMDCDFPFCGCDPGAEKVIDTLLECGWVSRDDMPAHDAEVERKARLEEAEWWAQGHICENSRDCPGCLRISELSRPAAESEG